jgi:hypothetical protein
MSSDLPGVDPATLNGMILYYCLMTKWSGLGDSTELSRVGLSQRWTPLKILCFPNAYVKCMFWQAWSLQRFTQNLAIIRIKIPTFGVNKRISIKTPHA